MFLPFTQKFKMAAKMAGKQFLGNVGVHSADTLCVKNFVEWVFVFYAEIQDGRQKWRENNFWEKSPVHISSELLYLALFLR